MWKWHNSVTWVVLHANNGGSFNILVIPAFQDDYSAYLDVVSYTCRLLYSDIISVYSNHKHLFIHLFSPHLYLSQNLTVKINRHICQGLKKWNSGLLLCKVKCSQDNKKIYGLKLLFLFWTADVIKPKQDIFVWKLNRNVMSILGKFFPTK